MFGLWMTLLFLISLGPLLVSKAQDTLPGRISDIVQREQQLPTNTTNQTVNDLHSTQSLPRPSTYWPLENPTPILSHDVRSNSSNQSTLSASQISCNGTLYGRNLNYESCMQVYSLMSTTVVPKTYGQRGTGSYDAPLPFRYLSRDGLCVIDLSHSADIYFDTILPVELREAAGALIQICVSGNPNQGGLITGLGVNQGLSMRLARYRPSVTCGPQGSGPPWITCRNLLDNMRADNQRQVFGPRELDNTTVALPWSGSSSEARCALELGPGDVSDSASWYQVWAAGNAVDYMCTHTGRGGIAVGIGKLIRFCLRCEKRRSVCAG